MAEKPQYQYDEPHSWPRTVLGVVQSIALVLALALLAQCSCEGCIW